MIQKYLEKLGPKTWYGKLAIVILSLAYLGIGILLFPFIALWFSVGCMSSSDYITKVTCVPLQIAVPVLLIVCGWILPFIKEKRARIIAIVLPFIFWIISYGFNNPLDLSI